MNLERLLNRLFKYDLSAALACILLPFVLWIGDGPRSSISDYAYGDISFIYVFLLTVAATLITTIGVRKDQTFTWILGLNLMLIPLTPHLTYPTLHTITSVIFFVWVSGFWFNSPSPETKDKLSLSDITPISSIKDNVAEVYLSFSKLLGVGK